VCDALSPRHGRRLYGAFCKGTKSWPYDLLGSNLALNFHCGDQRLLRANRGPGTVDVSLGLRSPRLRGWFPYATPHTAANNAAAANCQTTGRSHRANASSFAPGQKTTSIEIDTRQANTRRLKQYATAELKAASHRDLRCDIRRPHPVRPFESIARRQIGDKPGAHLPQSPSVASSS
jgi:hypothetical protein